MQYKIICEVTFPIYEITMDINVPINKSIYYLCCMLDKIILEEFDSTFVSNNNLLVNKKTGDVFDKNILIKDSTINNGSKLVYF